MARATRGNPRQECIQACEDSYWICHESAMTHCLEERGHHVEPQHFRLMLSCAAFCRTTAEILASQTLFDARLCDLCARICEACAASCRDLGDMDECVNACVQCARMCRRMAAAASRPKLEPVLTHQPAG